MRTVGGEAAPLLHNVVNRAASDGRSTNALSQAPIFANDEAILDRGRTWMQQKWHCLTNVSANKASLVKLHFFKDRVRAYQPHEVGATNPLSDLYAEFACDWENPNAHLRVYFDLLESIIERKEEDRRCDNGITYVMNQLRCLESNARAELQDAFPEYWAELQPGVPRVQDWWYRIGGHQVPPDEIQKVMNPLVDSYIGVLTQFMDCLTDHGNPRAKKYFLVKNCQAAWSLCHDYDHDKVEYKPRSWGEGHKDIMDKLHACPALADFAGYMGSVHEREWGFAKGVLSELLLEIMCMEARLVSNIEEGIALQNQILAGLTTVGIGVSTALGTSIKDWLEGDRA